MIIAQALPSVTNTNDCFLLPVQPCSTTSLSVSMTLLLPPAPVNEASCLLNTASPPRPRGGRGREIAALFKDSIPGSCLPHLHSSTTLPSLATRTWQLTIPFSDILLHPSKFHSNCLRRHCRAARSHRAIRRRVLPHAGICHWLVLAPFASVPMIPHFVFFLRRTGWCVALGGSTALDTLGSQAFTGGKQSTDLSVHFQRCITMLWLLFIPVGIVWANMASVLMALGQEEQLSRDTQQYLQLLLLAAPGYIGFECLKKYLQCQGTVERMSLPHGVKTDHPSIQGSWGRPHTCSLSSRPSTSRSTSILCTTPASASTARQSPSPSPSGLPSSSSSCTRRALRPTRGTRRGVASSCTPCWTPEPASRF